MIHFIAKFAARCCLAGSVCVAGAGLANAQVNVTTYHYDNYRTGWNPNETVLNQSNVTAGAFGLLQTVTLDDQVDAQPLLVNGVTINGIQHNVVYVATENNSVYAIDAQSGQVLLQTNLGAPVMWPQGCNNNGPNVGINSTPVIDTSTGNIYVIAYTLQNNVPAYVLHALSLATLADAVAPVTVSASVTLKNGKVYQFNAATQRQRPGLLLANGTIYAGFGSFCDLAANDSRGWLLGWQEGTLAPLAANKVTNIRAKSPNNFFLSSIWMSGFGLAASPTGSVFFLTGNSDFSGTTYNKILNVSESAVEMGPDLTTVQGLFTPTNHAVLDQEDGDFAAGGLMLLPPRNQRPHYLAAAAGKDGNLYVLDAQRLGKILAGTSVGQCWCGPSSYQASNGADRIITTGNSDLMVWELDGAGAPTLTQISQYQGVADALDPGFFTSVSSNGTTSGSAIVWAVGRPADYDPAYVTLYAINPDTGALLFSEIAGQWLNTGGNSNIVPVVANGLVYVASDQMLTIFGPGGTANAHLPAIRHVDSRQPLKPGEHEIYAKVVSMNGSNLVVQKRGGATVRIDAANAKAHSRFDEPKVGGAVAAVGVYDRSGTLDAGTVRRAKPHPVMWPPDR